MLSRAVRRPCIAIISNDFIGSTVNRAAGSRRGPGKRMAAAEVIRPIIIVQKPRLPEATQWSFGIPMSSEMRRQKLGRLRRTGPACAATRLGRRALLRCIGVRALHASSRWELFSRKTAAHMPLPFPRRSPVFAPVAPGRPPCWPRDRVRGAWSDFGKGRRWDKREVDRTARAALNLQRYGGGFCFARSRMPGGGPPRSTFDRR